MTTVRAAEARDREDWSRLFVEYGVFYETTFDAAVVDGVWAWLMDPAHEVNALVAEKDGVVIGFANYRRLADTFTATAAWNLDDLYVAPDARGGGAASALIDAVADAAHSHGGGTLRWITAADNTTAQSVYDKVATKATWITYEKET